MKQHLRRDILKWFGAAAALVPFASCSDDGTTGPDASTDDPGGTCAEIPEETAGPYPGDGSNGKNALVQSGVVRSDIRASFAGATGIAQGIPLTVTLKLVDLAASCGSALAGRAIYLWHCDREGRYSMYSAGVTAENYLRGVQETDANGTVTFQTIFPGCYDGRMPHMHFEIYPSLAAATSSANKVATSQLAFPDAACDEVYATAEYASSKSNYGRVSFASDMVFSDGTSLQVATVTGDTEAGYAATLQIAITG